MMNQNTMPKKKSRDNNNTELKTDNNAELKTYNNYINTDLEKIDRFIKYSERKLFWINMLKTFILQGGHIGELLLRITQNIHNRYVDQHYELLEDFYKDIDLTFVQSFGYDSELSGSKKYIKVYNTIIIYFLMRLLYYL